MDSPDMLAIEISAQLNTVLLWFSSGTEVANDTQLFAVAVKSALTWLNTVQTSSHPVLARLRLTRFPRVPHKQSGIVGCRANPSV